MACISPEQVRALRIRSQHLHSKASREDMAEVVRSLCGVNAQSVPAMLLSLRARVKGLEKVDIVHAIEQKWIVRAWAMRGTVHLLNSDDIGWIVSLLGPSILARGQRRRQELGLTDEILAKSLGQIPHIFNEGEPLTRGELMDRLVCRGIDIDRTGQAPYHLIAYAALKGLLYMGPDRLNGDRTFCLADKWIGKPGPINRDEALAGLACRYIAGYGPASQKDFASWSGLSAADARKGRELASKKEKLVELEAGCNTLWSLETQPLNKLTPADMVVNLLPAFDAYVLGYFDREYLVPKEHQKEIYHGGQTVPVVLVNGLAVGVWRYERQGKKLNVKVRPFGPLERAVTELISEEVEDIGRLFGASTTLFY